MTRDRQQVNSGQKEDLSHKIKIEFVEAAQARIAAAQKAVDKAVVLENKHFEDIRGTT